MEQVVYISKKQNNQPSMLRTQQLEQALVESQFKLLTWKIKIKRRKITPTILKKP